MKFPCEFILKIMGPADANLEASVRPILSKYIKDIDQVTITTRMSKGAKFTALTVKFNADSQEQLDKIYTEISSRPDVLMVL